MENISAEMSLMMRGWFLLQVNDRMKFLLSAAAGALGVFVTLAFIPEITALDLKDGDMRWEAIKRGKQQRSETTLQLHQRELLAAKQHSVRLLIVLHARTVLRIVNEEKEEVSLNSVDACR